MLQWAIVLFEYCIGQYLFVERNGVIWWFCSKTQLILMLQSRCSKWSLIWDDKFFHMLLIFQTCQHQTVALFSKNCLFTDQFQQANNIKKFIQNHSFYNSCIRLCVGGLNEDYFHSYDDVTTCLSESPDV